MLSVTRNRTLAPMGKVLRTVSTWSNVPAGPPDPILGEFDFAAFPNTSDSVLCCMANQYGFVQVSRKLSRPTKTREKSTLVLGLIGMVMGSLMSSIP